MSALLNIPSLKDYLGDFEHFVFQKALPLFEQELGKESPKVLWDATTYSLLGGKKFRAGLVFLAHEALGLKPEASDSLLWRSLAIESLHAYTLVHDDLPEIDNDAYRRGKPSTHAKFGVAMGVLTGDFLQTIAYGALAKSPLHDAHKSQALDMLLNASLRVLSGQVRDIHLEHETLHQELNETPNEATNETINETTNQALIEPLLLSIAKDKTASLIQASLLLGALGASSTHLDILRDFGMKLGLGFQIRDDLDDIPQDGRTVSVVNELQSQWADLMEASKASLLMLPCPENLLHILTSISDDIEHHHSTPKSGQWEA